MNRRLTACLGAVALATVPFASATAGGLPQLLRAGAAGTAGGPSTLVADPTDYVDPLIGSSGDGFTVPGATTPFGLTQVSPDTTGQFAYSGYSWQDPAIRGFSLIHQNGPGVPMGGDLPFLPLTAAPASSLPSSYAVPFSHAAESASPGAYHVQLGSGVSVDVAATAHGGVERYTFLPQTVGYLLAAVGRNDVGSHPAESATLGNDRLEGASHEPGFGGGYTVFFSARFSRPFDQVTRPLADEQSSVVLRFPAADTPVTMAVAVSFVDLKGARANLAAELPGFDLAAAQVAARNDWRAALGRVRVSSGADTHSLRTFYTAIYRTLVHPDVDSDVDGRYRGADGTVHAVAPGRRHYENFSLWDTIRGESAWLATLYPHRFADMIASLSAFADQDHGRLPRWSLHYGHPNYMNGDPAIPTVIDAVCRGIDPGVGIDHLYAQLRHTAFDLRDPYYLAHGYLSTGQSNSSVADSLEYADADFALAVLAKALGHQRDATTLIARAGAWRHFVHNGFLQPRQPDGSFSQHYDPSKQPGYREGTGWQYRWLVPHDQAALIAAEGGAPAYVAALDNFFTTPVLRLAPHLPLVPLVNSTETVFGIRYEGVHYVPGNEHDLEAPYLYDWAGAPSRTQEVVAAERSLFMDNPAGMPGNDDLGSLSAWYVWAAIGLYPSVPGTPLLAVGTPAFDRTEIRPEGAGAPIVVNAPGAIGSLSSPPYLAAATVTGPAGSHRLDHPWLPGREFRPGNTVTFSTSSTATNWGTAATDAPPSLSTAGLGGFGCSVDAQARNSR